jgi:Fur family ferric uptake transcriptional regulator
MTGTVDEAIQLIRQRGGRSTVPRRVVLETLIRAGGELRTAEDLLADIQARDPEITESTVYRTLALLEQLELVTHVHLGHGASHWYLSETRRRWYLACSSCGQVMETDAEVFEPVVEDLMTRTGFSVDAGHFAVTGTCAACTQRSTS